MRCYVLLSLMGLAALGRASNFYSIDINTDQLVSISTTGVVTIVGNLGADAFDPDLTYVNNRLFAINRTDAGSALWEINPGTGAIISSTGLTWGATTPTVVEGLAHVGGQLYASFSSNQSFHSQALGELALNGVLTNVFDYTALDNGADMDGLGNDLAGNLFSCDRWPTVQMSLYAVGVSPRSYTFRGTYPDNGTNPVYNDLDFLGADNYGISDSGKLLRISATGQLTQNISLSRAGTYFGIAAVPEPFSGAILGVGLVALLRRRVRSKKI